MDKFLHSKIDPNNGTKKMSKPRADDLAERLELIKATIRPRIENRTYSTSETARLAGVTLRQLQVWHEQSMVTPQVDGHRRIYQADQVAEAAAIAVLKGEGYSLQRIKEARSVEVSLSALGGDCGAQGI